MYKIKKDDVVIVIAGKDKGKNGQVLSVDTKNQKILVKGINIVKKHQKAGKTKGANDLLKALDNHKKRILNKILLNWYKKAMNIDPNRKTKINKKNKSLNLINQMTNQNGKNRISI